MKWWKSVSCWGAFATILTTGFTAWTAYEAHNSSFETARATRADVWLQMLNDYAAPEMLTAMKELRDWERNNPKDFASKFKALLLKKEKTKEEADSLDRLDNARRWVSHYFNKLRVLFELHVIEESDICRTWGVDTYKFIAKVLIPMERAKTEALFEDGSITLSDKLRSNTTQKAMIKLYRRVMPRIKSNITLLKN